mmetsp:Transcript_112672/g.218320  ORF Transcript_112672/g.218320 Transcript_112672/m.218320 type:complete len:241 (+) Transcript_112672:133-855(+)
MAICRPASSFCCGCSLRFGVEAIMVVHLLQNLFLWFVPVVSLFFHVKAVTALASEAGGLANQATVAGFGLAGIPVILIGLWGVRTKNEVPVRLYGYYFVLSFAVDLIVFIGDLSLYSPCGNSPTMAKAGSSFACGASRIANATSTGLLLGISLYCTFIVFSYAEELSLGGGNDLSDLAAAGMHKKQSLVGANVMITTVDNAEMYGTMTKGISGGMPIFGAGYHETNFPPDHFSPAAKYKR